MDTELFSRFNAWIDAHFEELLSDLEGLIRIPSVARYDDEKTPYGPECLRVLNHMRGLAARYGLISRSVDERCAVISNAPVADGICLWNHLDVVPAGEGWTYTAPFEPKRVGDYLIGRGAGDNKGPAVAGLYILRMFNELGVSLKHSLSLCLGTDEETRMSDVIHYAKTQPAAKLNLVADSAFPVCFAEKGIIEADIISNEALDEIAEFSAGMASNIVPDSAFMRLCTPLCDQPLPEAERVKAQSAADGITLRASGLAAHSAHPENGVNAIHELTGYALKALTLSPAARRALEFFTAINDDTKGTALGIESGDAVSGQTTCAGTMARMEGQRPVLRVNIRYAVTLKGGELLDLMNEACRKNGCTLLNVHLNEANYFPPENPVVNALTRVFNDISGLDKQPYAMGGGTYARKLPNAVAYGLGGLPVPETDLFAPGHGGAHQADEGLYLPNFKTAIGILAMAILEADGALA